MRHAAAFLALTLAGLALAPAAEARREFDTRTLTCAQINEIVAQRGQIVMNTGEFTYQRFVEDQAFCNRTEQLQVEAVPSRDRNPCGVRWVCRGRPATSNR